MSREDIEDLPHNKEQSAEQFGIFDPVDLSEPLLTKLQDRTPPLERSSKLEEPGKDVAEQVSQESKDTRVMTFQILKRMGEAVEWTKVNPVFSAGLTLKGNLELVFEQTSVDLQFRTKSQKHSQLSYRILEIEILVTQPYDGVVLMPLDFETAASLIETWKSELVADHTKRRFQGSIIVPEELPMWPLLQAHQKAIERLNITVETPSREVVILVRLV